MAAALGVRQPRWLAEGLAQFLETIQIAPDGKTAQLGMVNLIGLREYKAFRSVGVADALAWEGAIDKYDEAATSARYGISWALVHWMFNAHPQAFARYQLATTKGASAQEAWTVAFPNLTPAQADVELFQYISHGGYNVFTAKLPPPAAVAPKEEALRSADVHALEAKLMFAAGASRQDGRAERLAQAREELAKALVEEPGNLAALELSFDSAKPEARAGIAKKATTAHPESSVAWLMLGESMGDANSPEQQAAFLKSAALSPEDPEPLNQLAWGRVTHGQAAQALPYAMKAVNLAPADPAILDTLAAAFAGVGRCHDALSTERRAISLLPDQATAAMAQGYRDRLAKFQTVCAGKQLPVPPTAPAPAPASEK
jgi:tetratricopeptide (TPR) repeat protein